MIVKELKEALNNIPDNAKVLLFEAENPYECPFRESYFCTFGHSGSTITIEEDYNKNGLIAKRASIGGIYLNQCDADDCPLKQKQVCRQLQ